MRFKIFTIYDTASEAYTPPFFQAATGQAIRIFTDAVNDPQSNLYHHSDDYTLYELGEFDDNHATVEMYKTSKMLGRGIEYKNQLTLPLEKHHDEATSGRQKSNVTPIQPNTIGTDPT